MPRTHRSILLALLVLVGGLAAPALRTSASTAATVKMASMPGYEVVLYADHTDMPPSRILPPEVFLQRMKGVGVQTATFQVTYHSFPPEAQTAFQYAVDIWASLITSPVPIVVDATWMPLFPSGVLGSAGPRNIQANFPGAPMANTWYPNATANKLSGFDLDAADYDIRARFNSNFTGWYFGTDGNTPSNKWDFVSVVLHELGHGLGFTGSMSVGGASTNGACGSDNVGCWGYGGIYPFVYDRFAVNGAGQSLIDTNLFPNYSAALAAQLTSDNVFFGGANAVKANGGANVRLYAPSPWAQGSSYSHLDESAFPTGNAQALMTPAIANGEAIHNPGSITLCMFKDMGWTVTVSGSSSASASAISAPGFVVFSPDNVTVMVTETLYLPLVMNGDVC